VGVAVDEQMDRFGIAQFGLARLQRRGGVVRTYIACFGLGVRIPF